MDDDQKKSRQMALREQARSLWSDHAVPAGEDAAWFLRERVVWPTEDRLDRLGPRGRVGVLGGAAVAVGAVVAALVIAGSGGSGSGAGTTEAFVAPRKPAPATKVAPAPKPKKKTAKPTGPTLHGAPPDFSAAKEVKAGVGDGKAVEKQQKTSATSEGPAERGAGETPAATAKIGATPAASASAEAQADSLATASGAGAGVAESGSGNEKGSELAGPPAPKAAKQTARRFAEAFVVYEVGGVDNQVRKAFGQTSTKQLSRSLLRRPPRQPADVKVPQAKVVNVVAGPSQGTVYSVSVSLLRVGVTSELRLELEQGAGKKWQVTNVLG
jgi:hypothetical protein